jgi:hypothetical protein
MGVQYTLNSGADTAGAIVIFLGALSGVGEITIRVCCGGPSVSEVVPTTPTSP